MKEKISYLTLFVIVLVIINIILTKMDTNNYNNAIERCGSEDNVITNYTNQGDKYYSCKVDK